MNQSDKKFANSAKTCGKQKYSAKTSGGKFSAPKKTDRKESNYKAEKMHTKDSFSQKKNFTEKENFASKENSPKKEAFSKNPGQKLACPYRKKCGGCKLSHITYGEQLAEKQNTIQKLLGKYCRVSDIIGMEKPYHYRNKVQAAFGERSGRIISGVYEPFSHNLVAVENCLIEDETADKIIATVRDLMKKYKIRAFNDKAMKGFIRHVLVRHGFESGQVMVVLVTNSGNFPSQAAFIEDLTTIHPEITTIVRNINKKFTSMVLGDDEEVLFGNGNIEETLLGLRFRISPKSFYQVNSTQTKVLYGKALEFAGLKGNETVIDAYCGTGTIGLYLSQKAKHVTGVELNADAVRDAKYNTKLNNIKNIDFVCDDAGKFMVKKANEGHKYDVVVMDPPRSGSTPEFLKSVVKLSPKKVVYVSCGPESLARDLKILTASGYRVEKVQPVDMFPWTEHVETVCLLTKKAQV